MPLLHAQVHADPTMTLVLGQRRLCAYRSPRLQPHLHELALHGRQVALAQLQHGVRGGRERLLLGLRLCPALRHLRTARTGTVCTGMSWIGRA